MTNNLNFFRLIELVDIQARMKMKAQANKLFLSYLWWVLEPLLFVSLFYLLFEYILKRGGSGFFIFLIVGKVVFLWFSKAVTMGSASLVQNRGLIGQVAIPKWIFPLINVQEATYKSMVSIILMVIVLACIGISEPTYWWQLVPLTMLTYLFISSVSLILSILVAMAEDFSQIISLAVMGLMFGSGIFWDINTIPDQDLVSIIYLFNPVAAVIDAYRTVLINNEIIDLYRLRSVFAFSLILWLTGMFLFSTMNNKITRYLFS